MHVSSMNADLLSISGHTGERSEMSHSRSAQNGECTSISFRKSKCVGENTNDSQETHERISN